MIERHDFRISPPVAKIQYHVNPIKMLMLWPDSPHRQKVVQIAATIEQFGSTSPVLIGNEDGIVAGYGQADSTK